MQATLTYGSVCSGMEAATLAWQPLGWKCAFVSEIDRAPCALLKERYPDVPNFGDMTKFEDWPDVAIDLLVGGTPCQSFSNAGLRRGLADPRGSLMLTYGAIAQRYRPTWLLWENVPGVLSSNEGRDFGSFLGMLAELGYGFAYRVLDAQFFGLAQRRKRVFVVGYLGDWRTPAAVLFERESLRGDSAPRREAREGVAPTLAARTKGGGGLGTDFDCDGGDVIVSAFDARQSDVIQYGDMSGPLDTGGQTIGVQSGLTVRRLTPRECERLQGAPDDYTLVSYRGKPMADGPRYKMIGNSFAVNCVRWIGQRISQTHGLLEVDEAYTTRTCAECGSIAGPIGQAGLRIREWTCCDCGAVHDRDVNAARNILRLGLETLAGGAAMRGEAKNGESNFPEADEAS